MHSKTDPRRLLSAGSTNHRQVQKTVGRFKRPLRLSQNKHRHRYAYLNTQQLQRNVDNEQQPIITTVNSPQKELTQKNVNSNKRSSSTSLNDIKSYVDSRCRYWVENRISQLLNSDNFTTRNGYSFMIDNDRVKAGLCWRFVRNGRTVAKIDSEGFVYCSNIFANGTDLISIANFAKDLNNNSGLYVRHVELKNGEFVLDVKDITTDTITANSGTITELCSSRLTTTNLQSMDIQTDRLQSTSVQTSTLEANVVETNLLNVTEQLTIDSQLQNPLIVNNNNSNQYIDIKLGNSGSSYGLVQFDKTNNELHIGTNLNNSLLQLINSNSLYMNTQFANVLSAATEATLKVGCSEGNNGMFSIYYKYFVDSASRYTLLGNIGYPAMKFFRDKVEFLMNILSTRIDCNELYINNVAPLTDDSNYAKLNAANTFTANQTVNGRIDCSSLYINNVAPLTDDSNYAKLNVTNSFTQKQLISAIEYLTHLLFYDDNNMIIDFRKLLVGYNDRARITYETSGTYNNNLCLDINKSHSIVARIYSDGSNVSDYFTTIKHVITLLDGNGKSTFIDLDAANGSFSTSLTVNGNSVLTDDSNYAKLNATNIFTSTNEFRNALYQFASGLSPGQSIGWLIGRSYNNDDSASIRYTHNTTATDRCLTLAIQGSSGRLDIYKDRIVSSLPIDATALTVNNVSVLTDDSNYAKLNAANTFTANQTVNGLVTCNELNVLNNNISSGSTLWTYFGKSTSSAESALLYYYYNSTIANCYFRLGLSGYGGIDVYYNSIGLGYNTTLYGTLTTSTSNATTANLFNSSTNNYVNIGRSTSSGRSLRLRHYYNSTLANNYAEIGLVSYPMMQIYYNYMNINYQIYTQGIQASGNISTSGDLSVNGSLTNLDSTLSSGSSKRVYIGRDSSNTAGSIALSYFYSTTTSDCYASLGLNQTTGDIRLYPSLIELGKNTKLYGSLETSKTTPSDAFGDNMKLVILQLIYPVGTIYWSATDTRNPNTIFGVNVGTWTQITGYMPYFASSSQTLGPNGGTGGNVNHTHGLSNGYAHIGVGGENVLFTKRSGNINMTWAFGSGNYNFSGSWDRYGSVLGGNCNSGGQWMPYYRVIGWYRSA